MLVVIDATIVSPIVRDFFSLGAVVHIAVGLDGFLHVCNYLSLCQASLIVIGGFMLQLSIWPGLVRSGPYRLIGISSRWEARLLQQWVFIGIQPVALHQIWSLFLNNIMFMLQSTS